MFLRRADLSRIACRSRSAAANDWREVCGYFHLDSRNRLRFTFLVNRTARPGGWSLNLRDIPHRVRHRTGFGLFHSHPISEAVPGPSDIAKGFIGRYMLIYDVIGEEARLWEERHNSGPREVPLLLVSR